MEDRTRRYDDGRLRSAEEARDRERRERLADYRARLVDGPVLVLPMEQSRLGFNPQTLVPMEGIGTVYPTLQLVDRWGRLEVESGGALVRRDPKQATVAAPGIAADTRQGEGWRLALAPGWTLRAGPRDGDWTVSCDACEAATD